MHFAHHAVLGLPPSHPSSPSAPPPNPMFYLQAASRSLSGVADTVWPPNSGKDAWLRGSLAKWLLQAGFEGNNGEVLRQVRECVCWWCLCLGRGCGVS